MIKRTYPNIQSSTMQLKNLQNVFLQDAHIFKPEKFMRFPTLDTMYRQVCIHKGLQIIHYVKKQNTFQPYN